MNAKKTNKKRAPSTLRSTADTHTARSSLALGLSAAMLMPLSALAQTAPAPAAAASAPAASEAPAAAVELPAVKVQSTVIDPNPNAETGVPYKARTSGDVRHTRPLAETPQTISVLTKTAIDDSGFTDLKQILVAQPGITLGTGENGNAFGDRYIIRGQEARSDVFVDGLRDPGMSTRESFAVEQLEISKGPNSSFAGRGTAGGAINAITKQATLDYDFNRVSLGLGTDKHIRATADINKGFTDQFALRANVLLGSEDVPDRGPSSRSRNGLALSGLYDINEDLSVTVDYYGLRSKDEQPDLGGYLTGTMPDRKPARNVPVYAQESDFVRSNIDTLTARIKYRLSADTSINSLTRYGSTRNSYITTGASFGARYDGTSPTPYSTAYIDNGHHGWQDVNYFAHQTNVRLDRTIGGLKHEFILGAEYTDHKVVSGNFNLTNSGFNCFAPPRGSSATSGPLNAYCFTAPDGTSFGDPTKLANRDIERRSKNQVWHARTLSASLMDTVDITDKFTAFGGVRLDQLNLTLNRFNNTTGTEKTAHYHYEETLVNGHLGLSYKLTPEGMIYASVASAQDVNGGEADSGTNSGYGGYVIPATGANHADPEKSINFEVGTKWNVLDDQLLLTAAVFQTTKSDVMEGADYDTAGTYNSGKNRVRGIEFGVSGHITDKLSAQAGIALMKSEILKSSPQPVPANTPPADVAAVAANNAAIARANIGKRLANFANRSLSVQMKYQLTDAFSFGGAARYESKRYGGQPDTAAAYDLTTGMHSQPVPSYTVYDAFAAYRFNKQLDVRLNVLNVADKDYYTAVYRSGSFLYKGDGRAVRVTANYEF